MNRHLFSLTVVALVCSAYIAGAQNPFITTWRTTTDNESITIPTRSSHTYTVNWGDGITTTATGNAIHSYATAGTYTVEISGTFPAIDFYQSNSTQYSNDDLSNNRNKILTVKQWGDIQWRTMERAFYDCGLLTIPAIDAPDLSQVTDMSNMFAYASAFNQPLNSWNVSKVTNMSGMFKSASAFNQPLNLWDVSKVTDMSIMFSNASTFNQELNSWDVSNVTNMSNMLSHAFAFNQPLDNKWDVSKVTDMSNMFSNASAFNQSLDSWNVSNVTNMSSMFSRASAFNQPLDKWDVSKVTTMNGMFQQASAFNQSLNLWDVSNVTNMSFMFSQASAFNQPLDKWDVSKVTTMIVMFQLASAFNQELNLWDVSNVTNMISMFSHARSFNQPLDSWNVSNVTDMSFMFNGASAFSQLLESWDVRNVTGMSSMFQQASAFNQSLNLWDVSNVTNMSSMFQQATAFNQPLDKWNVSKVTNMSSMFYSTDAFNQPLNSWNVINVTNMGNMFYQASAFNQSLNSWNVSNVTNMTDMLNSSGLSIQNYDLTLQGWAALASLQSGVSLGASGLIYCEGKDARTLLINDHNWTISSDRQNCQPVIPTPHDANVPENTTTALDVNAHNGDGGGTDSGITYSLSGDDAGKFSISSAGVITFKSSPDFEKPADTSGNNVYNVIVTANDGIYSVEQSLTITVTNANDNAPVFTSDATSSLPENTTTVLDVNAHNGDGGGTDEGITYTLSGEDLPRFRISPDGTITFREGPDYEAPADANTDHVYKLIVMADDGSTLNNKASQSLTITVTNANDNAPVFTSSATSSLPENTTDVVTLTTTDADGAENVVYTLTGGNDRNLFSVTQDNKLSFVTAPDFDVPGSAKGTNTYEVEVTATNNAGQVIHTTLHSLVITVTDENEAPVFTSTATTATFVENGTGVVMNINAHNGDGGTTDTGITYSLEGDDVALFDIVAGTGLITFKDAPNHDAPADADMDNEYHLVVHASDGAKTSSLPVIVIVTGMNETPVFTSPATARAVENTMEAPLDVNAHDGDGGEADAGITYSLSGTDAGALTIDDLTGIITFAQVPDYEAPADADKNNSYLVTVTATDQGGSFSTQSLTLTVTDVNEAPVFTSTATTATFVENGTGLVMNINAYNGDGGTTDTGITYSLGGADAALFDIVAGTGLITFKDAPDYEAPGSAATPAGNVYAVDITATDNAPLSVTLSVTIEVTNMDEAPVFVSATTADISENTATTTPALEVDAHDGDGGKADVGITYRLNGTDAGALTIDGLTGIITFAQVPDYEAPADADKNNSYLVTVTATDQGGSFSTQSLTLTVTDVNEAPVFTTTATTATFVENGTGVVMNINAHNGDGGTTDTGITYSLGGADAALFNLTPNSGLLSFKNAPDYEAPGSAATPAGNVYAVDITATDNAPLSVTLSVTIEVTNMDEAPVFVSATTADISENTATTTPALEVEAHDGDGGAADVGITYRLNGTDAGALTIDGLTGIITFAQVPDYEAPTDADKNNSYLVTVTATDQGGSFSTQSLTLTVTDVNEAPVFTTTATTATFVENGTGVVMNINAHNGDGGTTDTGITYSLGGADAALFNLTPNSGLLSFKNAPDYEAPGSAATPAGNVYAVDITATDNAPLSVTLSVTIEVTNMDEAPVFVSATTADISENTATTTPALEVDAHDGDGGKADVGITYRLSGTDTGALSMTPEGIVTFAQVPDYEAPADADKNNSYLATVTATDQGGSFSTQSLILTVTNANDSAPVFTSASSASVPENTTAAAVTLTATDADGQSNITYRLSGGADKDLFSLSGAKLFFAAAPDFEIPADTDKDNLYLVVVTAHDGAYSVEQSVQITVTNTNDKAPMFTSASSVSVPENTTAVTTLRTTDDTKGTSATTYRLSGGADKDLFTLAGAELAFKRAPDFELSAGATSNNSYTVEVSAEDGIYSTRQVLSVAVTNANDSAPVFTSSAAASVPENTSGAVVTLTTTDADGQSNITYRLSGGADKDLFSLSGAKLFFAAAPDFEIPADTDKDNLYQVVVTAHDGAYSVEQSVQITVTNTNDKAPVFTSASSVSVPENTTAVTTLRTTDDIGGTSATTYRLSGGADKDLFTLAGAELAFKRAPDFELPAGAVGGNSYTVEVSAEDGIYTTRQVISVAVTNANDSAPVFTSSAAASVPENTSGAVVTLTATDADGQSNITYRLSGGADKDLFSLSGAKLAFAAAPDFEIPADTDKDNLYQVVVTTHDGAYSVEQSLQITVTNTNDKAPMFTSASSVSVPENTTAVTTLRTTDDTKGTSATTYRLSGGADKDLFTLAGAELAFKRAPDFELPAGAAGGNSYTVEVSAEDGIYSTRQVISVTVTNANDSAPVFTSAAAASVQENAFAVTTLSVTDADGKSDTEGGITYRISGGDDAHLFKLSGKTLTFTAAADFERPGDADKNNIYAVAISAHDGGNTTTQTLTVTVTNTNDNAPAFTSPELVNVKENLSAALTLEAADPDGSEGITFTLNKGAYGALFTLSGAQLSFKKGPDFEAPAGAFGSNRYTVEVSVSDGLHTALQTLQISVTNENDNAPVFTSAGQADVGEGTTAVLTLAAEDVDKEGTPVTFSLSGGADRALFVLRGAELSFVSAPDFEMPADAGRHNSYQVEVAATDGVNVTTASVSVRVTNANDNAPVFAPAEQATIVENTRQVLTLASVVDADAMALNFSLSGGADKALFTILDDELLFIKAPDFENPADAGADNSYVCEVSVSDGLNTARKTVTVLVTNENDNAPVFTSVGEAEVMENTTKVMTLTATDSDSNDSLTFSVRGIYAHLFTIRGTTLSFVVAPDFEQPADTNGDNHFTLTLVAGDGKHETEIFMGVKVINLREGQVLSTPADLRLSVYPNPATDVLMVEGTLKEGELQLVNLMGVTVLRQQFTGRARLELAHLPEGLYLLQLHSGHKYSAYKVMKK